jgi:hypothetical protein
MVLKHDLPRMYCTLVQLLLIRLPLWWQKLIIERSIIQSSLVESGVRGSAYGPNSGLEDLPTSLFGVLE